MELTVEYIPALIVAKNEEGNYIKISESDKDGIYYCPVCNGIVKPRAKDSDKVQPHYYHTTETNCSNESILHWMFKNWLFEKGSKFTIGENEYEVKSFDMEKTIDTPFGVYIPDLTIETDNETMYFEINYSSCKDKTFSDKWTYLGNKVIEVNVKELINSELYEIIPNFKTIFENGEYTKEYKTYERKDRYVEFKNFIIDERKEEQVKEIAEKFDWFWREIKSETDEDIITCLDSMKYSDAVNCAKFLKKIKCHDKFKTCQKQMLINAHKETKKIINDDDYFVDISKSSAQIYELKIYQIISGIKICCDPYKIRTFDGTILYSDLKDAYDKTFESIKDKAEKIKKELEEINKIKVKGVKQDNLEKIITISNHSGYYNRDYDINLIVNIFSEVTNKWERVYNYFYDNKEKTINDISHELSKIEHNILKQKKKEQLIKDFEINKKPLIEEEFLKISNNLKFVKSSETFYPIIDDVYLNNFNVEYDKIDEFVKETKESFEKYCFVKNIVEKINNCKNKFWKAKVFGNRELVVYINNLNEDKVRYCNNGVCYYSTEEKFMEDLLNKMNELMNPMSHIRGLRYNYYKEHNLNYITINTERNGLHE